MKLKGKLILSCAALAAVATTAFSTTYAWYTSNDTVTATGLVAKTETAGSDSLQISSDGKNWKTTVDLGTVVGEALRLVKPVAYTADTSTKNVGTFKLQNSDATSNPVSDNSATATTGIVQFNLYFRNVSSTTSNVYLKSATYSNTTGVTAQQTTPVLPNTKLIADLIAPTQGQANSGYTTAQNTSYTVDLLRALDVEIQVATGTVASDAAVVTENVGGAATAQGGTDGTAYANQSTNVYNLEQTTYSDTLQGKTGWNALTYYNAVKGLTDADGTATPADATDNAAVLPNDYVEPSVKLESIADTANGLLASTTPTTIVKTTWTIFLDGWDPACYDAVKAQSVKFDFSFSTSIS